MPTLDAPGAALDLPEGWTATESDGYYEVTPLGEPGGVIISTFKREGDALDHGDAAGLVAEFFGDVVGAAEPEIRTTVDGAVEQRAIGMASVAHEGSAYDWLVMAVLQVEGLVMLSCAAAPGSPIWPEVREIFASVEPKERSIQAAATVVDAVRAVDIPESFLAWRTRPRGAYAESLPAVAAQDLYAALIKDEISPAMREHGLVGSGGRYAMKSDSHWALVGFQKSRYSDRAEVQFTVNLLAVSRDEWQSLIAEHPHYGAKPSASVLYAEPVRSTRIGYLLEDPEDRWWRIYDGQDIDRVRSEVISALIERGLPWLREQIATH